MYVAVPRLCLAGSATPPSSLLPAARAAKRDGSFFHQMVAWNIVLFNLVKIVYPLS